MTFSETARLRIRGYRESDLDKLVTLFSDARTMRGSPMFVVPKSEMKHKSELPELFEKSPMGCILETKEPLEDGNEWVGMVLLMANGTPKNRDVHLGIALDARHWGKGYATEVTRWVVNHAFTQLDMHRVSLIVLADNLRAISAYQTVGFVEEGRVREANYQDGKWWDIVNMGILAREWKPNE